jgi:predicted GNAT superfamily acetyltransferase
MAEEIQVRPVRTLEEARAAAEVLERVWEEPRVVGIPLLWAMASHGGQVLAAFRGDEVVGTQVGVVGLTEGKPTLHSHITGVLKEVQHEGVGFRLKLAQREWCLERGIGSITWTFDPMVARNAYFNLMKLGAIGRRFYRDYYGEMEDTFNRGDRSDRLEVIWELESERVRSALGLDQAEAPTALSEVVAPLLIRNENGQPLVDRLDTSSEYVTLAIPDDYHTLRSRDAGLGKDWRDAVADALEAVVGAGYRAVAFVRGFGYLLQRP